MTPVILPRSEHPISRKQIDPDALKVLYRLKQAGHVAYLVGGGVRDLLLGRRPKDFDISTSAHPNEVKRLFRNCRLIGRRFRLAHILFGAGKVIEVATFRRKAEDGEEGADLLVRRENTFGTPEEDATRRDLTINGLFYDIATFSVIDFVGGLKDLEERVVRTIGDPSVRMREDPVRMLRAVKFAARLGFHISPEDLAALRQHRHELLRAAPERLLLEAGRLLGGGYAAPAFRLLEETGLLEVLAPEVSSYLARRRAEAPGGEELLWRELEGLDRLVARRGGGPEPDLPLPVLLGALLTPVLHADAFHPPPAPRPPVLRRGLGFAIGEPADAPDRSAGAAAGAPGAGREAPEEAGGEEPVSAAGPGWERGDADEEAWEDGGEPASTADAAEPEAHEETTLRVDLAGATEEGEPARPAGAGSGTGPGGAGGRRRGLPVFSGPEASSRAARLLAPLVLRLAVPRRDTERLLQVVSAQRRLRHPGRGGPAQRLLARKPYFPEALLVLEAHVLGTSEGEAEARQWRQLLPRATEAAAPRARGERSGQREDERGRPWTPPGGDDAASGGPGGDTGRRRRRRRGGRRRQGPPGPDPS